MNEICKYLGVGVISIIAILIIIRTLSWQQSIIKRVMVTREGMKEGAMGFGDSDSGSDSGSESDSDSESECDFKGTQNNLVKLMALQKENKKTRGILDPTEKKYYDNYYDSSDEEWDTGSEGEGELEKICAIHKRVNAKNKRGKVFKDAADIRASKGSGNSMPSSGGGGGGMFG